MKIAFFLTALQEGGAERVATNLANRLSRDGHEITVITLVEPSDEEYRLDEGITRRSISMLIETNSLLSAISMNIKRVRSLRQQLVEHDPDVLIAFMTASNVTALLASIRLPFPVIVSERSHPPNTDAPRYWQWLRTYAYRLAASVVVLSSQSRDWIHTHIGDVRSDVIPNFVTWPPTTHEGGVDPSSHLADGQHMLLAVGRLVPEKGYPLLVEAFARIADRFPDWQLRIVGSWDPDELQTLINRREMQQRITLVGGVGNVADWYRACDVYVMSSISEGFPNSLAEAMASGSAVISFDCDTGPRDLIEHEHNGLLVPAEDIDAMSAGLARLFDDEDLRQRLAAKAIGVRDTYSESRIMQHWNRLLTECVPAAANTDAADVTDDLTER